MTNISQNKGCALVFSMLFLFTVISFISVYIFSIANGSVIAHRTVNEIEAYYVADAGLVDAYERITQAGINTIPTTSTYIPSPATDNGVYSFGAGTGNYKVSIVYSNSPRTTYTITSTGTFHGVSKTLRLQMIGASVSKYAYWSNTESSPIYGDLWWMTGMITTGPVQTNGTLNIYGNPVFVGPVTQAGPSIDYYPGSGSNPNEIFTDGLTLDSPQINLPAQATLGAIYTVANDGSGLVLTGPSIIFFNANGTLTVTNAKAGYNNTTIQPPANGVIYVQSSSPSAADGNVTVQGTVSGQLTVASDQNIYVSGSVSYNKDPRDQGNVNSTDMVGLVANQNITILSATAPASLEMSGVMVALQGSFQVDNYWVGGKGNMDQFGSLVNNYCGPTGVFDPGSGTLYGGWNQIQSYDPRLATIAPPGFPPYVNNSANGVYTKLSIQEL